MKLKALILASTRTISTLTVQHPAGKWTCVMDAEGEDADEIPKSPLYNHEEYGEYTIELRFSDEEQAFYVWAVNKNDQAISEGHLVLLMFSASYTV